MSGKEKKGTKRKEEERSEEEETPPRPQPLREPDPSIIRQAFDAVAEMSEANLDLSTLMTMRGLMS